MKLSLSKLNKEFGNHTAVKSVDLEVEKGEIFTILGESGSGKTTVLRMIVGFETPTNGVIKFGERVISSRDKFVPPEERSVGLVFQDLALFPHMTVEKNIIYGMKGKVNRSELDELINLCKLSGLNNRYPHQISGGEMQRVALARAIASKPDILLLDEPFNNLDVLLKESILRDVKKIIKTRGITALFVTHHKDEAYYLSDRIAVMKRGEFKQVGTPLELYYKPNSLYTASFLGKTNILTKKDIVGWVRPEDIDIKKDIEGNGIIKDICFQGHHIDMEVELTDDAYSEKLITVHSSDLDLAVGDIVSVSLNWQPFNTAD